MKYRINLQPKFWNSELIDESGTQTVEIEADRLEIMPSGHAVFSRIQNQAELYTAGVTDQSFTPIKILDSSVFVEISEVPTGDSK
jgi:hypothetical protein